MQPVNDDANGVNTGDRGGYFSQQNASDSPAGDDANDNGNKQQDLNPNSTLEVNGPGNDYSEFPLTKPTLEVSAVNEDSIKPKDTTEEPTASGQGVSTLSSDDPHVDGNDTSHAPSTDGATNEAVFAAPAASTSLTDATKMEHKNSSLHTTASENSATAGAGVTGAGGAASDELFPDDDLYEICYDDDDEDDDMLFDGEDMDFMENEEDVSLSDSVTGGGGGGTGNGLSSTFDSPEQVTRPVVQVDSSAIVGTGANTAATANRGNRSSGGGMTSKGTSGGGSGTGGPHRNVSDWNRRTMERMKQPRTIARQPWHNEATDKQHRQTMILEIARLLQSRKKAVPSNGWLQQLPHKARKLEGRLYLTATSLEGYKDRTTLKVRLKMLANVIMVQFKNSKKARLPHSLKLHSAATNTSSAAAAATSTVASSSASATAQSKATGTLLPPSIKDTPDGGIPLQSQSNNNAAQRSSSIAGATGSQANSEQAKGDEPHSAVVPSSDPRRSSANSLGGSGAVGSGTEAFHGALGMNGMTMAGSMQHLQQQGMMSTSSSDTTMMNPFGPSASNALGPMPGADLVPGMGNVDGLSGLQQQQSQQIPGIAMASSQSVTELERQKAVNARLQEQIMENIRRQEELVRRLQAQEFPQPSQVAMEQHQQPQLQQQQQQQQLLRDNFFSGNGVDRSGLNMYQQQQQQQQQHGMHNINGSNNGMNLPMHDVSSGSGANRGTTVGNLGNMNHVGSQPAFSNDLSNLGALLMGNGGGAGGAQLPNHMLQSVLQNANLPNQYSNSNIGQYASNGLSGFQNLQQNQYGDMQRQDIPLYNNNLSALGGGGTTPNFMGQQVNVQQQAQLARFGMNAGATGMAAVAGSETWDADARQRQQLSMGLINQAYSSTATPKQGL